MSKDEPCELVPKRNPGNLDENSEYPLCAVMRKEYLDCQLIYITVPVLIHFLAKGTHVHQILLQGRNFIEVIMLGGIN